MKNKTLLLHRAIRPEYFFWSAILVALFGVSPESLPTQLDVVGGKTATTAVALSNPFEHVPLLAKAAVVYDAKTRRILFAKDADEPLPLASLTKVMTAMTALSLIPETTLIPIDREAIKQEGDGGFSLNEEWILRDLLRFMLLQSSNDAAYAVAEGSGGHPFFIAAMNAHAEKLGLTRTHFENETGLDLDATRPGAVGSARETALLFAEALTKFPRIFTATRWSELLLPDKDGTFRSAENTNHDTNRLPLLLASKTGFTDLAGGNLAIAFDADFGHPIIVVVLGSTAEGRFTDAEGLVWAALHALSLH